MENEKVYKPDKIEWVYGNHNEIIGAKVDGDYFFNINMVYSNPYLHEAYHAKIRGEDDK